MTTDVLIVGGGVIGLSIAFHLCELAPALTITLVDGSQIGGGGIGQASFAAAGMLAPFAEAHVAGPLVKLGIESLGHYPDFIARVRDIAGDLGDPKLAITGPGMLRVAANDDGFVRLHEFADWQRSKFHAEIETLNGDAARQLEPGLAGNIHSALLSPHERQVDPQRLTRSLAAACSRLGVHLVSNERVTNVTRAAKGYAVRLLDGMVACEKLVLAGGAWTEALGKILDIVVPVFPVRGQILALAPPALPEKPLRHTIYASGGYLVPRPEGHVVVGATEEPNAGFAAMTFDADITQLRNFAADLVPCLRGAPLDGPAVAGLRPASPDGLPVLGTLASQPNLHIATGHFRNGILLTPITGKIIAHGIVNGTALPSLAPEFSPDRFNNT